MTIGFIGVGNMGSAMIRGMIAGGMPPEDCAAYDVSADALARVGAWGVRVAETPQALLAASDVTVLAVKPHYLRALLQQLADDAAEHAFLSIVTGWTQQALEAALPSAAGIARAMPNTPAQVGQGVIALNENHTMAEDTFGAMEALLSRCAKTITVPESLFDAVTAISGSGPAYAYMFIEALADAGVREGLPRQSAYTLAAQTLAGAAAMVLETGEHPGRLKDNVASPGGTTIEAVYALERGGLRAAVMDAVDACARKAALLAKRQ